MSDDAPSRAPTPVAKRPSNEPPPPGALLTALLVGGGLGAVLGLALDAALRVAQPEQDAANALRALLDDPFAGAGGSFAFAGAVAGFLVVGKAIGNGLAVNVLRVARRTVGLIAGLVLGMLFGLLVHVGVLVAGADAPSAREAAAAAWLDLLTGAWTVRALLAAGGAAGVAIALSRLPGAAWRAGRGVVAGVVLGGLAGLLLYCGASALVASPRISSAADLAAVIGAAGASGSGAEALFVGMAATAGGLLARYSWRLYGIVTFVSLLFVVLGYLAYSVTVTLPLVPPGQAWLSGLLLATEGACLLLVLLYSFYTIDVAARKHWLRSTRRATFSPYYLPKVAVHVPSYNEPFPLVQETLERILRLDYPQDRLLILVGDDSTDEECARPLREFCAANGIRYIHRTERSGYKAGALNALLEATPPDTNLLAVVDADYQVEPEFLRETVGYFVDPRLGWLQTPQDYRNRHESFLTEQYYLADAYFYRTILPSRNEENSIIFCGTMGLLRRRAVLDAGGWSEAHITEDAELSVRLLNSGWISLYINKTYGRGLIPATFDGYQKQHYRWAFGGGRILRGHVLRFLFGRFTFRQRLDYMMGSINWFEGLFIFAIALTLLGLGVADLLGLPVINHHSNEILLVGLVPMFLLADGLTRVHMVLRQSVHLGLGGTLRMLGMWFSVKFSNMRAAVKGFLGFSIPFLRTPKMSGPVPTRWQAVRRALRLTRLESGMAVILLVVAVTLLVKTALMDSAADALASGRVFLGFWLLYYFLVFSAAPLYAYKSFVTLREQVAEPPAQPSDPQAPGPAEPMVFQEAAA